MMEMDILKPAIIQNILPLECGRNKKKHQYYLLQIKTYYKHIFYIVRIINLMTRKNVVSKFDFFAIFC